MPDVVLSVHTSIIQQLVPTKVYRVKKQKEQGLDLCAHCATVQKNQSHNYYVPALLSPKQSTRRDTIQC